jgi:hypothetical protein
MATTIVMASDNVPQSNTPGGNGVEFVSADIHHEPVLSDKSKELQRDTFFFVSRRWFSTGIFVVIRINM